MISPPPLFILLFIFVLFLSTDASQLFGKSWPSGDQYCNWLKLHQTQTCHHCLMTIKPSSQQVTPSQFSIKMNCLKRTFTVTYCHSVLSNDAETCKGPTDMMAEIFFIVCTDLYLHNVCFKVI